MKGDKAEYIIPLGGMFNQPRTKRCRKLVMEVKRFVLKHAKVKNVSISRELNEFLGKNSSALPRKIDAVLVKRNDAVVVYLKKGKQLAEDEKKILESKKKSEEKKKPVKEDASTKGAVKAGEASKAKTPDEEKAEEEKERLLKEKRERERLSSK